MSDLSDGDLEQFGLFLLTILVEALKRPKGLTSYDEAHFMTCLRLRDAHAEGADWREIARVVLHLDPEHESDRVRRAFDSHLSPNG